MKEQQWKPSPVRGFKLLILQALANNTPISTVARVYGITHEIVAGIAYTSRKRARLPGKLSAYDTARQLKEMGLLEDNPPPPPQRRVKVAQPLAANPNPSNRHKRKKRKKQ